MMMMFDCINMRLDVFEMISEEIELFIKIVFELKEDYELRNEEDYKLLRRVYTKHHKIIYN